MIWKNSQGIGINRWDKSPNRILWEVLIFKRMHIDSKQAVRQ